MVVKISEIPVTNKNELQLVTFTYPLGEIPEGNEILLLKLRWDLTLVVFLVLSQTIFIDKVSCDVKKTSIRNVESETSAQ